MKATYATSVFFGLLLIASACRPRTPVSAVKEDNFADKTICAMAADWWVPMVIVHTPGVTATLGYTALSEINDQLQHSPLCYSQSKDFSATDINNLLSETLAERFINDHMQHLVGTIAAINKVTNLPGGNSREFITQKLLKNHRIDVEAFSSQGIEQAPNWANAKMIELNIQELLIDKDLADHEADETLASDIGDINNTIAGTSSAATAQTASAPGSIAAKLASFDDQADKAAVKFYGDYTLKTRSTVAENTEESKFCRSPEPFSKAEAAFMAEFANKNALSIPLTLRSRKAALDAGEICNADWGYDNELAEVNAKVTEQTNRFAQNIKDDLKKPGSQIDKLNQRVQKLQARLAGLQADIEARKNKSNSLGLAGVR